MMTTKIVDKALIVGLIRFDMVYTKIEMFLTPFPDTKYEMTKSSKDIVKAIRAPEITPGIMRGTITFVKAPKGVHPKSKAASAKSGSKRLSLGKTVRITYGVLNAICAISIVQ